MEAVAFPRLHSESQINEALLEGEESGNLKVDCEVSAWSAWSHCNVLENCGRGYKTKHRFIKVLTSFFVWVLPVDIIKKAGFGSVLFHEETNA